MENQQAMMESSDTPLVEKMESLGVEDTVNLSEAGSAGSQDMRGNTSGTLTRFFSLFKWQGSLGDLERIPIELRRTIYRYVLDLCSLPKDYVKGQVKITWGRAIRTGILTASKAINAESSVVMFESNQFTLYSLKICTGTARSDLNEKYAMRLFLTKYSDVSMTASGDIFEFLPGTTGHQIDFEKVGADLLGCIKYLVVNIPYSTNSMVCIQSTDGRNSHLRKVKLCSTDHSIRSSAFEEHPTSFNVHTKEICVFLKRCTSFHHLQITLDWDSALYLHPAQTNSLLLIIDALARNVRAVKNLQLLVQFRECQHEFPPLHRRTCCYAHILSAEYYRHVTKCMRLSKDEVVSGFGNRTGTKIRRVDPNWWQDPRQEDGAERLTCFAGMYMWDSCP